MNTVADAALETTPIASVVTREVAGDALKRWNAFIPVCPSETSRHAAQATLINPGSEAVWYQHVHQQVAQIEELGVNLLDHVVVSGQFYAFRNGQLLVDSSEPSRVTQSFAAAEGLPPRRLVERSRRVVLDPPALLLGGAGYQHWGHWLLDFLPRLGLAQAALGPELDRFVVPLPDNAPAWVTDALRYFGGISNSRLFRYDCQNESVYCNRVVIPSVAHNNYFLHSFIKKFYQNFTASKLSPPHSRLFVSRRKFHATMPGAPHFLVQAEEFEAAAERRGYQVVFPEEMSLADQIARFAEAQVIAGPCGSGLHNAIFAGPGTIMGQIGLPNAHQSRIAGLCDHHSVYLIPDQPFEPGGRISVGLEQIDIFFTALDDAVRSNGHSPI